MKLEEMTRNIPDKIIKIAMVLNERGNQILGSNSQAYIKEFWRYFPLNKIQTNIQLNLEVLIIIIY